MAKVVITIEDDAEPGEVHLTVSFGEGGAVPDQSAAHSLGLDMLNSLPIPTNFEREGGQWLH